MPGFSGALAARVRHIDECLMEAIRSGFKQLVIRCCSIRSLTQRHDGF